MITIEQVNKLRNLHDKEAAAYKATHESDSLTVYANWVKVCDELNKFIESIAGDY